MGEAIVKAGPVALSPKSWDEARQMAKVLSESKGFVPRELLGNPHAVLAAIMTGAELGIGPMQSLRSIHVLEGRPMLSADLMLSLAIRGGVKHQWLDSTAEVARLRLTRDGFDPHEHTFTIQEAQAAGLAGRNNWKKYPAAMLRARCLSAALRAYCPDVLGAGVYVEGEVVDEPPQPEPQPERVSQSDSEEPVEGEVMDAPKLPPAAASAVLKANLRDCETAAEVQTWCEGYGPKVLAAGKGNEALGHVLALKLEGVTEAEARSWLGLPAGEEAA